MFVLPMYVAGHRRCVGWCPRTGLSPIDHRRGDTRVRWPLEVSRHGRVRSPPSPLVASWVAPVDASGTPQGEGQMVERSAPQLVTLQRDGGVALVTLNRPEVHNA